MKTIFPMYVGSIEFADGPRLIVGTNSGNLELSFADHSTYYFTFQGEGLGIIDIASDQVLSQPMSLAARWSPSDAVVPGSFSLDFNFTADSATLTGIGVVHIEDIGIDGALKKSTTPEPVLGNLHYKLRSSPGKTIEISHFPGQSDVFVIRTETDQCVISITE